MSHYIAGGLMILLLCAAALLGLEGYGIVHASQMVEAALLDGQAKLAAEGGVSPAVVQIVRKRIAAEGGDLSRLGIKGSQSHTPYGESVTLEVSYGYDFALTSLMPGAGGWQKGTFQVEREATTVSGWQP